MPFQAARTASPRRQSPSSASASWWAEPGRAWRWFLWCPTTASSWSHSGCPFVHRWRAYACVWCVFPWYPLRIDQITVNNSVHSCFILFYFKWFNYVFFILLFMGLLFTRTAWKNEAGRAVIGCLYKFGFHKPPRHLIFNKYVSETD